MVLDRAREEKDAIFTYGPMIHNPQVVSLLSLKKISSSRDLDDFSDEVVCFISAHGISPERRKSLKATGACICDASCPDVLRVQGQIRSMPATAILRLSSEIGGHTEVKGLLGFCEG